MFWKTSQALDERTEFAQLGDARWRATYRGFVTVSAEGRSPRTSQMELAEAFDVLLASLVRSSRPPAGATPPTVEEIVPKGSALALVSPGTSRRRSASADRKPTRRKPRAG